MKAYGAPVCHAPIAAGAPNGESAAGSLSLNPPYNASPKRSRFSMRRLTLVAKPEVGGPRS
jgi:hypothetical protein